MTDSFARLSPQVPARYLGSLHCEAGLTPVVVARRVSVMISAAHHCHCLNPPRCGGFLNKHAAPTTRWRALPCSSWTFNRPHGPMALKRSSSSPKTVTLQYTFNTQQNYGPTLVQFLLATSGKSPCSTTGRGQTAPPWPRMAPHLILVHQHLEPALRWPGIFDSDDGGARPPIGSLGIWTSISAGELIALIAKTVRNRPRAKFSATASRRGPRRRPLRTATRLSGILFASRLVDPPAARRPDHHNNRCTIRTATQ